MLWNARMTFHSLKSVCASTRNECTGLVPSIVYETQQEFDTGSNTVMGPWKLVHEIVDWFKSYKSPRFLRAEMTVNRIGYGKRCWSRQLQPNGASQKDRSLVTALWIHRLPSGLVRATATRIPLILNPVFMTRVWFTKTCLSRLTWRSMRTCLVTQKAKMEKRTN